MNKMNRSFAIVASIILILNYIGINLGAFLLKENNFLLKLETGPFRVIFTISFIIAFYFLANYFRSLRQTKIEKLILIGVAMVAISMFSKLLDRYGVLFDIILFVLYVANLVVTVIWGIKVLKLDDNLHQYIRLIKIFIINLFIVFGLGLIGTPILMYNQLMDYSNLLLLFYIIPYFILTVFYIKNKEKFTNR